MSNQFLNGIIFTHFAYYGVCTIFITVSLAKVFAVHITMLPRTIAKTFIQTIKFYNNYDH